MEERIRATLKGKHLSTLREELKVAQSQISKEEVDSLPRKELIGLITLLRKLNNSEDVCKRTVSNFDRGAAEIREEDGERAASKGKGSSHSEVFGDPEEGGAEGGFVISKPIVHSLTSLVDEPMVDPSVGWHTELLKLRFEQEAREKEWEKNRILEQERQLELARVRKEEKEEKQRERDENERLRLEQKEQKRIDQEQREEQKRIDRERRDKAERDENERLRLEREEQKRIDQEKRDEQKRIDRELREKVREQEKADKALEKLTREREKAELAQQRANKEAQEKSDKELQIKAEKEEKALQRAALELRVARESEERNERERKTLERELNSRLRMEEDARLDKLERDSRYQEDKLEKARRENRYETRLQRANDLLKGRIANFPESVQQMTTFFKALDYLFASFNIENDLKNPILVPFLTPRAKRVAMSLDIRASYEDLKKAIFSDFNHTPKLYQKTFLEIHRAMHESATQFASRLSLSLELYLESREINRDYDRLCKLLVSDRLKSSLDYHTRLCVSDREMRSTWLDPKQIGLLVDAYQSERGINGFNPPKGHNNNNKKGGYASNANYTRSGQPVVQEASSAPDKGSPNKESHPYMKADKSGLRCDNCGRTGHDISKCYRLQAGQGAPKNAKSTYKVRRTTIKFCIICGEGSHRANKCEQRKTAANSFKVNRVKVLDCDPSLALHVEPTINSNAPKLLRFKDLLLASGVHNNADSVSFEPIDPVTDARINQLNMMPGFVPVVPNLNLGEECKLGGGSRETCFNMGGRSNNNVCTFAMAAEATDNQICTRNESEAVASGNRDDNECIQDMRFLFNDKCDTSHTGDQSHTLIADTNVTLNIGGKLITFLLDSGSQLSVLRKDLLPEDFSYNDSPPGRRVFLKGA